MFPELRPLLMEVFEQAEEGAECVITRYRKTNSNLRTQLERIVRRAGLEPWPRLFQNLRSSRETELAENHPLHVVTASIGNSKAIAAKHYLQVRDSDFERAAHRTAQSEGESPRNDSQGVGVPLGATPSFEQKRGLGDLSQVLARTKLGDEGNRTLIPALRTPCAPVTPRPQERRESF
jgi:hypothetical protein